MRTLASLPQVQQDADVVTTHTPQVSMPRTDGRVTVRLGGLDEDLDALNAGNPFWWGKDFMVERIESSPPDDPWFVLVGELDGVPVAYAFLLPKGIQAGGRAMADIWVLPKARRNGVGRALLDVVAAETAARGLPGLLSSLPDDDAGSLAAVRAWGCTEIGHHRESVLDLETVDDEAVAALVVRVEDAGIVLEPLTGATSEEEWRRVYHLVDGLWADTPDADGASDSMPFEVWRAFFTSPDYVLVARRDGVPVAADMLMDRAKDEALNILLIGVASEARGLGLAAAMMARHAQLMRDSGHRRLYTQNMDQNTRILAANDRVGFRVESGFYDYAYDLA
jgi:GNAT superfamily N-acetyltransferase